jgi:hypothetical protein
MVKPDDALVQTKPISIYSLYDAYAGMLLGYIFEVVKDRKVAEEYLVKIFSTVAEKFTEINWYETNNWCQLQRFAKNELTAFKEAVDGCETPVTGSQHSAPNKYLDQMTEEQKHIFCNFYYNKKTTAQLSQQLNRPEDLIRRSLKEAFAIIRRTNDN